MAALNFLRDQDRWWRNHVQNMMLFHQNMMLQHQQMLMYYDDIMVADVYRRRRQQRRWWTRPWLLRRPIHSFSHTLVNELRLEEPRLYQDLLGVNGEIFDHLIGRLGPRLQRQDTNMRRSICAK